MSSNRTRREFVGGVVAAGTVAALAGCTGDGGGDDGSSDGPSVTVGPDDELVFDPEEITVSVGETVTWEFDSPGHNVSARPEHSEKVQLPDGAEPFASYEGDSKFSTESEGATFQRTFETVGTYQYVCVPHAAQGMVGRVVVEE